jgi:diguanylate cyclase (GGDEF)-like protein
MQYSPWLVGTALLIALGVLYAGLRFAARVATSERPMTRIWVATGAVAMGVGIWSFTLDDRWLSTIIAMFAFGLLIATLLITSVYEAHLQSSSRGHARRLEAANAQLQHQATHDALTGLPNRVLFLDRLGREIAHGARGGGRFAVLLLDLDRFKLINDTLGHAAGDQLLTQVARRLGAATRDIDTVARTGGDEFLVLIADTRDQYDPSTAAVKIGKALSEPFLINDTEIHSSASIGISIYPADGADADTLVAHADEAMYFAKQRGRNSYQFFNPDMSVFSQDRLELENDLRRALQLNQMEVHYQPKSEVATGRVSSVEALLRWRHPTRGLVSPTEFVPLAEECGLILPIGEWVLREACRQARAWQVAGVPFIRVAVNVSPMQFRQSNFLEAIQGALLEFDLEPQYLEIELTESTVMGNAEGSIEILEQLSRMGVVVSIDDFGTGYSSMSYLRKFPIDKLKIDRSFISELTTNPADASIVRAIISLAHSLRLKVVAEGVETPEQLQRLRELGCDQYQGFLMSAAVDAQEIERSVRSGINADALCDDPFMKTQSRLAPYKARSKNRG